MAIGTTATTELSIQARAEQLEAAIQAAHSILDGIAPRPDEKGDEANPESNGAMAALGRCDVGISHLGDRLRSLAGQVGAL